MAQIVTPQEVATIKLTADMLRSLLDGEVLEFWQGTDVRLELDPAIGPFEMGVIVGKSLRARELIADAEKRLREKSDGER